METLERTGLADETLVVFTSDHGDMDSAHRMEHKTALYEESAHVPFLVRGPKGSLRGIVDDEHLISNGLDLFPTLCDYAGVEPPEELRGLSFRPLVERETDVPWREGVMVESEIGRLFTTGRYKFVRYTLGKETEQLYDLQVDPGEMHDHSKEPENAEIVARHREMLDRELEMTPPVPEPATE
jgi:choline-sulfatase